MTKTTLMPAMLMAAALLTTPVMAQQGQPSSHRVIANARNMTIARSAESQIRPHSGIGDLSGFPERDVWGHWGAYYGPMVHVQ